MIHLHQRKQERDQTIYVINLPNSILLNHPCSFSVFETRQFKIEFWVYSSEKDSTRASRTSSLKTNKPESMQRSMMLISMMNELFLLTNMMLLFLLQQHICYGFCNIFTSLYIQTYSFYFDWPSIFPQCGIEERFI